MIIIIIILIIIIIIIIIKRNRSNSSVHTRLDVTEHLWKTWIVGLASVWRKEHEGD